MMYKLSRWLKHLLRYSFAHEMIPLCPTYSNVLGVSLPQQGAPVQNMQLPSDPARTSTSAEEIVVSLPARPPCSFSTGSLHQRPLAAPASLFR